MYDVLHDTRIKLGHSARDRMCHELNFRYKNITQNQITSFLHLCEVCQKEKSGCKKGVVVEPMVFDEFNSRGQLDLIDLQSHPDGEYKFIFVYQDHLTKFITLHTLISKHADEVAHKLLDVFLTFGAHAVSQSNNGRKFANYVNKA